MSALPFAYLFKCFNIKHIMCPNFIKRPSVATVNNQYSVCWLLKENNLFLSFTVFSLRELSCL